MAYQSGVARVDSFDASAHYSVEEKRKTQRRLS
ncbi:hypothetical protein SHM7688_00947 [Shimia marina]|uniref:Uncharacterized protein n=1 Tax=Shimia marina TaxID=321267 RepID=A0A0P1EM83_9RHOB|nr:hypothetical protein SHM7688_00947 [Shimia marina]